MLILARFRDERIVIQDAAGQTLVDVFVVDVNRRPGQVHLGFTADPCLKIHRYEIAEAIRRDREAADGIA